MYLFDILTPLLDYIDLVKDETGAAIFSDQTGSFWTDNILEWGKSEGYILYIDSDQTLEFTTQDKIELPLTIDLDLGWNIVSYPIQSDEGVDIKVVDASTGEVRRAENIEVSMTIGSGMATKGITTGDIAADPLSDIQRRAAKMVAAAISESIFPIEVITFREDSDSSCCAYVNYGEALLTVGDRLKIIEKGEPLIDEATGLDLGSTEKTIGVVEVTESLAKFSKAKIISGGTPGKGQLARIIKDKTGSKSNTKPEQREKIGRKI